MFKKNTAVVGFPIGNFINASTGATVTTGTPVETRLIDGTGAALTNAATYNTDAAQWEIDLEAADMNGDVIGLSFALTDCLPISYTIKTVLGVPQTTIAATGDLMGLAADAITSAKIADNAFSNEHFADGALTSTEITSAGGCVVASIGNNVITALSIADGAITDAKTADDIKVDVNTIKTQTVTCAAGVTVLASVGTAATSTAQTGDSYAIVNGDHGLVSIQDDIDAILADTNELQTDWTNGGRLDLILDAASAPSAATVADAVWDELIAGHAGVGSTGAALAAAGGSGDPWATALPGAYGAGTAGKLIGDNINAPIATVDTVVDALATELAKVPKEDGSKTFNATCSSDIKSGLSTQAELNKVPKSDGVVSFNATALTAIGGAAWDVQSGSHLTAGTTGELLHDIDTEVDTIHDIIMDLAVTGAPLNTVANGITLTTGTETTGTYASTEFSNGVYHVLTAAGATPNGIIDIEYLVTLPNSMSVPTSVEIEGYLKESPAAGGDSVNLQIYNYNTADWDIIMPILFTGIVTDGPSKITNHNLLARHVGTAGGDLGKMRIRLYSNSLETGTTLNIDKLNIGYAEAISSTVTTILADTNDIQVQLGAAGAGLTSLPPVTLANGTHGGAAATITAKSIAVTNSDAGGVAVTLTGSGSGNSHALRLASANGSSISATAGSHAITVNSSAGDGLQITGATNDINADITGTLATCTTVTNMLTAAAVNAEVDTALNTALPATGATTAGSINDYIRRMKFAMCNRWDIVEASGNLEIFDDSNTSFTTVAAAFTTLAGVTLRKKVL